MVNHSHFPMELANCQSASAAWAAYALFFHQLTAIAFAVAIAFPVVVVRWVGRMAMNERSGGGRMSVWEVEREVLVRLVPKVVAWFVRVTG